jgi:hypothetical protein
MFEIIARVHGPASVADFRSTGCAVLMDLLPGNGLPANAAAQAGNAFILQEASRATQVLCQLALDSGFTLRFDLPPDTDVPGDWPVVARTARELEPVMRRLVGHSRHELLYPFSIWGIEVGREQATYRAIEAFQSLRMDGGLFDQVLVHQGFRIALFQWSLTISVNCADLDRTIAWAHQALEEPGPPTTWASESL